MNKIKIGNKFVGEGQKPYFIADIASNHDGDIERAYKLIELAKKQEQMLLNFRISSRKNS